MGAAYEAAGFAASGNAAEVNGCRLMKRQDVQGRIAELRANATVVANEKFKLTQESLIQLGLDLLTECRSAGDLKAASSTYERVAKIAGLWVDRTESSTTTRLISDRPARPMDETEWLSTHRPN